MELNTLLTNLLNISERLYPRSHTNSITYMYGEEGAKEYNIFNDSTLHNEIRLHLLKSIIGGKINDYDYKKCIKYIFIRNKWLNYRPSHTLSIQCAKFDSEIIMSEKIANIKKNFVEIYSKGKHIGGIFHLLEEAIRVPQELLTPVVKDYLQWKEEIVKNSGLRHLTIYWSAKEICQEFNKRRNNRFNFRINFSDINQSAREFIGDNSLMDDESIIDFDWDSFAKS